MPDLIQDTATAQHSWSLFVVQAQSHPKLMLFSTFGVARNTICSSSKRRHPGEQNGECGHRNFRNGHWPSSTPPTQKPGRFGEMFRSHFWSVRPGGFHLLIPLPCRGAMALLFRLSGRSWGGGHQWAGSEAMLMLSTHSKDTNLCINASLNCD